MKYKVGDEVNVLTDISPERLRELEESGVHITKVTPTEEWEKAQLTEPLTISERLWAWRYKYYPWERAETEAYSELVILVLDIDKRARESELRRIKRMLENNV